MAQARLYQPFLEERNVRRLYRLKVWFREHHGRRMPMTVLLNRIIDDFFTLSEKPVDAFLRSTPSPSGRHPP
jgi:hypothetical protein